MTVLLGIDCATDPRKTGLALAKLDDGVVRILRCGTGTRRTPPDVIAIDWLRDSEDVLIALDAPLGWPRALSICLSTHKAGLPVQFGADQLFGRATDLEIKQRLGKRPLEVGANLIARTAVAALTLLDRIRQSTNLPIPLAWTQEEKERWRAIEVYPAATRIGHGAPDKGGSLEGLNELLDCSALSPSLKQSKDAIDATVCALAAADFILGRVVPPVDHETAYCEGWIWAPPRKP